MMALISAVASAPPAGASTITDSFSYTGAAQTWTVPDGVTHAVFEIWGAQGGTLIGGGAGGKGGHAKADLTVTPNTSVQINVGGAGANTDCAASAGGFNGGGNGAPGGSFCGGAGGGGATDVRIGGTAYAERQLVAGGGGGACGATGCGGGTGGGTNGGTGSNIAAAGGQTAATGSGSPVGGNGQTPCGASGGCGGGGGGGFFGGAGGPPNDAGGGGSGYSLVTPIVLENGIQSGNGAASVTWSRDTVTTVTSSVNPQHLNLGVTITAKVALATGSTATIPVGTVDFAVDGTTVATGVTLDGTGRATHALGPEAAPITHTVDVTYHGGPGYTDSTSSTFSQVWKADSTTTLSAVPTTSVYGQSVTLTATVAPVQSFGAPTGSVEFFNGTTSLGTQPLSGTTATATLTTTALPVATNALKAVYSGDGTYFDSTGNLSYIVSKANTTTTFSRTPASPTVFGQPVTLNASVAAVSPGAGTPTGTVNFTDNGNPLTSGTLSSASTSAITSALSVGDHTLGAGYGGDGNFNTSTASPTIAHHVDKASTTTALTAAPTSSSVFGQAVTLTATVSVVSPGAGTPSGTVSFKNNGTEIATATVTDGVATVTTTGYAVGTYSFTATYLGDGNFNTSTSTPAIAYTVNKADTTTALSATPASSSVYGQSVSLTATVAPVAPGSGVATGTVTFKDGGSTIGTRTLSGGQATFTTSALAVSGSHSFTATYAGDTNFNSSSTASALSYTVNKANTTTALSSSPSSASVYGQNVTLTATVSAVAPGAGTPSGTVTFKDNGASIGTVTLSGGMATFSTTGLAVSSSHSFTASFGGDGNFNTSASTPAIPFSVAKANTTTGLVASPNSSSVWGQSVTLTATVSPVAPGGGTPSGTVTFLDNATPIGTGTLSGGVATYVATGLAVGSHSFTAAYPGDTNYNNSGSAALPYTVNQASTSTTLTSNPATTLSGQPVTFTAAVAPVSPGAGSPSGFVSFYDGSTLLTTVALSGGSASYTTSTLSVGAHAMKAVYGGDTHFLGSNGTLNYQVDKAFTTTTVTASPDPSTFGQPVTLTATVAPVAPGVGTPTGFVQFMNGASNIGSPVQLVNGSASVTLPFLAPNQTITAAYGGDNSFKTSTGSVSPTVRVDRTITGSNGAVSITGGTVLVSGATLAGGISISGGASVFIVNSRIGGQISASNGGAFGICGSTAQGVSVSNASGFVLVGDPGDDACAGNTINGNVVVSGSTAGVEVAGNPRIGGSLSLINNRGSTVSPEDALIEVEGNTVTGSLSCSSNTPGATNDNQPNTVGGSRAGQCAGF